MAHGSQTYLIRLFPCKPCNYNVHNRDTNSTSKHAALCLGALDHNLGLRAHDVGNVDRAEHAKCSLGNVHTAAMTNAQQTRTHPGPLKSLNKNSLGLTGSRLERKVNRQLLDGADLEIDRCAADGKCRSSGRVLEPQVRN